MYPSLEDMKVDHMGQVCKGLILLLELLRSVLEDLGPRRDSSPVYGSAHNSLAIMQSYCLDLC